MKVIVDIPEDDYNLACNHPHALIACYAHYIKAGVPLPKKYGRLIDVNNVISLICSFCDRWDCDYNCQKIQEIRKIPTVIEAEGEDE